MSRIGPRGARRARRAAVAVVAVASVTAVAGPARAALAPSALAPSALAPSALAPGADDPCGDALDALADAINTYQERLDAFVAASEAARDLGQEAERLAAEGKGDTDEYRDTLEASKRAVAASIAAHKAFDSAKALLDFAQAVVQRVCTPIPTPTATTPSDIASADPTPDTSPTAGETLGEAAPTSG